MLTVGAGPDCDDVTVDSDDVTVELGVTDVENIPEDETVGKDIEVSTEGDDTMVTVGMVVLDAADTTVTVGMED